MCEQRLPEPEQQQQELFGTRRRGSPNLPTLELWGGTQQCSLEGFPGDSDTHQGFRSLLEEHIARAYEIMLKACLLHKNINKRIFSIALRNASDKVEEYFMG